MKRLNWFQLVPSIFWRFSNTTCKACLLEKKQHFYSYKLKLNLSSFKSSYDLKRKKMGHTVVSDIESSSVTLLLI